MSALALLIVSAQGQDFPNCRFETAKSNLVINGRHARLLDDTDIFPTHATYYMYGKNMYRPLNPYIDLEMYVEPPRGGFLRFHNIQNDKLVRKVFTVQGDTGTKYVYLFNHDSCRLPWSGKLQNVWMNTLV